MPQGLRWKDVLPFYAGIAGPRYPADLICPFSTGSRAAPPTHLLSAWWVHAEVPPVRGALTEQNFTSGLCVPKEKRATRLHPTHRKQLST